MEQLIQKEDKRQRTREYRIVRPYSGSWLPVFSMGVRVGCRPPCTDEPRIQLAKGDHVRVTRWKKHWLYGDKVIPESTAAAASNNGGASPAGADRRVRGWFPRRCAVEFVDNMEPPASSALLPEEASGGNAAKRVSGVRKRPGDKKRK